MNIIAKDECPVCKGSGLLAVSAVVASLRNLPRCPRCFGKGHIAGEVKAEEKS